MNMILCCGESLIDMIPTAADRGQTGFVPHSGGAVFNTAIGLGRLGISVGMLSGVSTDQFGAQLEAALQDSHVDTKTLVRSDRLTTLAMVHLVDGKATYTFYDENSAGRMVEVADLPELSDDISTLYLGGISLCAEPLADTMAALAAREAEARVIMVDPNIRPGFIEDEATYRARLDGMIAVADVVKVSDEDLDWIVPEGATLEDKARHLQQTGAGLVLVTCGGEGAYGYLPDGGVVFAESQKVEVQDTVGAGDTFNSGFLAALSDKGLLQKTALARITPDDLKEALSFAAKVAAVTVSRAGANPPWRDELV